MYPRVYVVSPFPPNGSKLETTDFFNQGLQRFTKVTWYNLRIYVFTAENFIKVCLGRNLDPAVNCQLKVGNSSGFT